MKITIAAAAALALLAAAPALAKDFTPAEIIQRHMAFGAKNDAKGMAGDYADDAVIIQGTRAVQGKAAILESFTKMLGPTPGGPAKLDIRPVKIISDGDVGMVFWQMPSGPHGEDSFLVRHGKILVQAVFPGAMPAAPR